MSASALRAVVAGLGAALLLALTAWHHPSAAPAAPRPRALTCDFTGADELAWDLRVASTTGAAEPVAMTASLRLRPLRRVERSEWLLAGRFEPAAGFSNAHALRAPFVVRVGTNCRFQAFAWRADATADEATAVASLLRTYEVILNGAAPRWEASHHDANGVFIARYRRAPDGATIDREGGDYLQPARPDLVVRQLAANARFTVDADGRWVRALHGESRHHAELAGQPVDVRLEFSIERTDRRAGAAPATLDQLGEFSWAQPRAGVSDAEALRREQDARARQEFAGLAGLGAAEIHAQAQELFLAEQNGMHEWAFQRLRGWLLVRPEAAGELLALLRAGRTDPRMEALLFLALGEADTASSRRALIEAMRDPALSVMNRQRAASALGAMHTPTMEAVEALRAGAVAGGPSRDDEMTRGVAMRALGQLAGDGVPAEVAEAARTTVRASIASRDLVERVAGLDAAGNARSATLLPEVQPALADDATDTRASAAHALRGLDRAVAQPLLADRLSREENPTVVREVTDTLIENARGEYDDAAVRAAIGALPRTPAAATRSALIRLLGEASGRSPAAREALIAWVAHETEPTLIQQLGRYLDTAALHEGLARRAPAP